MAKTLKKVAPSVSLNNTMRRDILERLFDSLVEANRMALHKVHLKAGEAAFQALYPAPLRKKLVNLPQAFWNESKEIEIGGITDHSIKDRSRRDQDRNLLHMPVFRQAFARNYGKGTSLFRRSTEDFRFGGVTWDKLTSLPLKKAQRQSAHRFYTDCKLDYAERLGLITGERRQKLEEELAGYIAEARVIVDRCEAAFVGAAELLTVSRTTKALRETWPECEKFLDLDNAVPEARIIPVSVLRVNEAMAAALPS